ncbi:MAG TPA: PKD domain-containing protein, partial [Nitrospirota bacterium]|nr:PKD domain-containing protein [Nitrospirota bacterium]
MTKYQGCSRKRLSMFCLILSVATCILALPIQTKAQTSFAGLNYLFKKNAPSSTHVSFAYSPTHPQAGQLVQFSSSSNTALTSWSWNFGDGTISSDQNPSHTFIFTGFYRVTLTAGGSSGSKSLSQTISVMGVSQKTSTTTATAPVASFTYSPASPIAGQAVQFTDTSTGSPTSWQWNFGDGATSTVQNPSHAFASAASYTVTLTATNGAGSKSTSQTVVVSPALAASFTYSPASPVAGQAVQFTDTSTGSPTSWQWNFGDG